MSCDSPAGITLVYLQKPFEQLRKPKNKNRETRKNYVGNTRKRSRKIAFQSNSMHFASTYFLPVKIFGAIILSHCMHYYLSIFFSKQVNEQSVKRMCKIFRNQLNLHSKSLARKLTTTGRCRIHCHTAIICCFVSDTVLLYGI